MATPLLRLQKFSIKRAPKVATNGGIILAISGGLVCCAGAAAVTFAEPSLTTRKHDNDSKKTQRRKRIETNLMERLAQKPYFPYSHHVPKRLKILTIDVPEFPSVALQEDADCRVNLSQVYTDGIAPSKTIALSKSQKMEIVQKSLAQSLIKCRSQPKSKRTGIEILQLSLANLNPLNLRKTHQFGTYRYDPAKYTNTGMASPQRRLTAQSKNHQQDENEDENEDEEIPASQHSNESNNRSGSSIVKDDNLTEEGKDPESVLATEEDEIHAPWHQYAWMEELHLRISGKVPFGATLFSSSRLSQWVFGSVYQTSIPANRRDGWWWKWCLGPARQDECAGHVWNPKHRRGNQPHVVIANGAALQRIPGSLRLLQKMCMEYNVELFIVDETRSWVGSASLEDGELLGDIRTAIKHNLIQEIVLSQETGRRLAFARGRRVGQVENEAKWQAKEMKRKTRQAIQNANEWLQRNRKNDWSSLTKEELLEKLMQHKVIQHQEEKRQEAKEEINNKGPGSSKLDTMYSQGMIDLAKQCVKEVELQEKEKQMKPTTNEVPNVAHKTGII